MDSCCVEFSDWKFLVTWWEASGYFWAQENAELFHDWVHHMDVNREFRH